MVKSFPKTMLIMSKTDSFLERTTPFSLKGGGAKMIPMARPRIVVDGGELVVKFAPQPVYVLEVIR